jgi:hypothetical protein
MISSMKGQARSGAYDAMSWLGPLGGCVAWESCSEPKASWILWGRGDGHIISLPNPRVVPWVETDRRVLVGMRPDWAGLLLFHDDEQVTRPEGPT